VAEGELTAEQETAMVELTERESSELASYFAAFIKANAEP
jgi:hypothetical protein